MAMAPQVCRHLILVLGGCSGDKDFVRATPSNQRMQYDCRFAVGRRLFMKALVRSPAPCASAVQLNDSSRDSMQTHADNTAVRLKAPAAGAADYPFVSSQQTTSLSLCILHMMSQAL
jgi:hypothetical protein